MRRSLLGCANLSVRGRLSSSAATSVATGRQWTSIPAGTRLTQSRPALATNPFASVWRTAREARPVRFRRGLTTEAKGGPTPQQPIEEPVAHTVESLTESFYAYHDAYLNVRIGNIAVPRFWVGLVAFNLFGLGKDLLSLNATEQIAHNFDLTPDQKNQLNALAGDKEDFVLAQIPTAVSMSDPTTLLTLPVLSSLFAASIAIWWGRFRVKKHFEKFLYLENKKGNTVTPDVIEGARKGIISRTVTASAAGTMALTTTYISFYAIITRVWFRKYVDKMNEWRWSVPAGRERELDQSMPSKTELQLYCLASCFYFMFIQYLVLTFTPYVILPSFAAFLPISAVLSQSPVFLRMQEKTRAKLATLEHSLGPSGGFPSAANEPTADEGELYGMADEESDQLTDEAGRPAPASGPVFNKAPGAQRVRAIVSRGKRQEQGAERESVGDESHGKENQWGDVVLEDEQNQQ